MRPLLVAIAAVAVAVALSPSRRTAADEPGLPPDLALVPPTALGFGHVRLAEVWKNDALRPYRAVFEKAGPKAIGRLDEWFTPAPSTADRLTAVAFLGKPDRSSPLGPVHLAFVVHFTAPFDAAAVRTRHLPNAERKEAGGKEYFVSDKLKMAIAFAGDRTLVLGDEADVKSVVAGGSPSPALAPAIKAAASGKHVVAALNVGAVPVPAEALEAIPEEYRGLAAAKLVTLTADVAAETTIDLRVGYGDEATAAKAEKSFRRLADAGRVFVDQQRQRLEAELNNGPAKGQPVPLDRLPEAVGLVAGLGGLNFADELLAKPPVERAGADLTAKVTLPAYMTQYVALASLSAGALLPAVQKTREGAAIAQSQNNLKQIGLALHNYHDANGHLPPAAICDKKGKPLLSWRVAILPYLEQDNVYKQFKLDEPWDSDHNKQWSRIAIKTYTDPRADVPPGQTVYKAFVGNGAMFDPIAGTKFAQISDGLSNTVMVAAGGDPVPWAKPDDIAFDPTKPVPELAAKLEGKLLALFGDGSVRTIREEQVRKNQQATLKALITRGGGEVIADDF